MSAASPTLQRFAWQFFITSAICLVISLMTRTIWDSPLIEHLAISLGFGYSNIVGAYLFMWMFPHWATLVSRGLALLLSLILGSANAMWILRHYSEFGVLSNLSPVISLGAVFSAVCLVYFYLRDQQQVMRQQLDEAKIKEAKQQQALALSQLKQLQSQIEPHFLFNTLANIHALIAHEPKQAQQMLAKLTDLLRCSLTNSRQQYTRFSDELNLLEAYLSIQQVRLGQRLRYHIEVAATVAELYLPPMLLQPLVENALVHGIEPKADGGELQIKATIEAGNLQLQVIDNGLGFEHPSTQTGHGIGLQNVRQRLAALYGETAQLQVYQVPEGGVRAQLTLPIVEQESAISGEEHG